MSAEEMDGYIAGVEMEQGRPAEKFGYPDPRQVLEWSRPLELTAEQKNKIRAMVNKTQREAASWGRKMVAEEKALDGFFSNGLTDGSVLANRLEKIGGFRWKLRLIHLGARVQTRQVLTPEQIIKYRELRSTDSSRTSRN